MSQWWFVSKQVCHYGAGRPATTKQLVIPVVHAWVPSEKESILRCERRPVGSHRVIAGRGQLRWNRRRYAVSEQTQQQRFQHVSGADWLQHANVSSKDGQQWLCTRWRQHETTAELVFWSDARRRRYVIESYGYQRTNWRYSNIRRREENSSHFTNNNTGGHVANDRGEAGDKCSRTGGELEE